MGPYLKTATNPPWHAVAYSATHTGSLFAALNTHTLRVCRAGQQYELLLSFWASVATEALVGQLGLAKSGRKEVQRQTQEDVLLKILPVLSDGFKSRGAPGLTTACYTLSMVLATKGDLADHLIDSLMDSVAETVSTENLKDALLCLYVICRHRSGWFVSQRTFNRIMRMDNVGMFLGQLAEQYEVDGFVLALYSASLRDLQKKAYAQKIAFADTLIRIQGLEPNTQIEALMSTIEKMREMTNDDPVSRAAKTGLLDTIRRLNESKEFKQAVGNAISRLGIESSQLEADLQMLVEIPASEQRQGDIDIKIEPEFSPSQNDILDKLLSHVPQRTVDERSFLSHVSSHLFEPLKDAFLVLSRFKSGVQQFQKLPIWHGSSDATEPLFISFLIRIAFGPFPAATRRCAMELITQVFRSQEANIDGQALLPYATAMLADPDALVRKETANLLIALENVMPNDLVQGESCRQWGAFDLYSPGSQSDKLIWLPSQDICKIINRVYIPMLEECILDPTHICRALESALKGSSSRIRVIGKPETIDLKKPLRSGLFDLLMSHLTATQLYALKSRLLIVVKNIDKVGPTSRTKHLLPMLTHWSSLSPDEAQRLAQAAQVELPVLEATMAAVIPATDKDCVQNLLSLAIDQQSQTRPTFARSIFDHMIKIWPLLNSERQVTAAQILFDRIFRDSDHESVHSSRYAKHVLISVSLPTEALVIILDKVYSLFARMREHSPVAKRRRASQTQMIALAGTNAENMKSNIATTTFTLELVDNSKPEDRPQLLGPLFQLLAILQLVKAQTRSELSYIISLNLGSLLEIVCKAGLSSKLSIDESVIRTELVIDCVRMTESPQVQNLALLLIASLCKIVPGRVLHNVMPIFTMMGTGVLRKDDEHSVHVIDQTIDLIIPPLIESLLADRRDIIVGTSELLASFVAAYDHVPSHRRLRLLSKLITKLGPENFLYIIIAMLVTREAEDMTIQNSLATLMNAFNADIQLRTFERYIDLIADALKTQPTQAQVILGLTKSDSATTHQKAINLVHLLSYLLGTPTIQAIMRDQANVAYVQNYLPKLLQQVLDLDRQVEGNIELAGAVKVSLTVLLDLPAVVDYINIVQECLRHGDSELRSKLLRLLEIRLQNIRTKDRATQQTALAFLSNLADILTNDSDITIKHASLTCIDRISEEFGRSDIPAVVEIAYVVAGDTCLGEHDRRVKITALLCLASMVEILKESILPVIPNLMPRVFKLWQESMADGKEDPEEHNAILSLLSGILSFVPFVISDTRLNNVLAHFAESANAELGPDCDESRHELLELLARRLDLKSIILGLHENWPTAVENGFSAIEANIDTLSTAVERNSKSTVVKNTGHFSDYLQQALDFRRVQLTFRTEDSFSDEEVIRAENAINNVMIKITYKLNDTTFRPIFSSLIDWATKCPDIKEKGLERAQLLRETSLFSFLAYFFGTLKSIVTSYASYILEPANEHLKHASSFVSVDVHGKPRFNMDVDMFNLWLATLSMLREAFTHDADAFFASPSHFDNLAPALISQLKLSASENLTPHVLSTAIPTIVALATAVIDSPTHLKTLNHHICLLRHSESAAVRMASVQCQAALTRSEELGSDWAETCIRSGEGLVYANEMLEDDDEDVVGEVRRWVASVSERLGEENIFEA